MSIEPDRVTYEEDVPSGPHLASHVIVGAVRNERTGKISCGLQTPFSLKPALLDIEEVEWVIQGLQDVLVYLKTGEWSPDGPMSASKAAAHAKTAQTAQEINDER